MNATGLSMEPTAHDSDANPPSNESASSRASLPDNARQSATASDSAVAFEHVSFRYSGAESDALRNIDLSIRPGECAVLTGESGCGKTTLTRAMNGLIPLVYQGFMRGDVTVNGKPITAWTSGGLAATVGSVFQNPRSQFVNSEVEAELAFGCENQGLPREEIARRVCESAQVFQIEQLLHRRVEELSGGQRQMVILASVYATHPDIFVLDEPTAALDVTSMRRLGQVLARLKASGKTIIVSEHRLWWLSDFADRVIVMKDGCVAGVLPAAEFGAVSFETRLRWGLRAWRADEIDDAARQRFSDASASGGSAMSQGSAFHGWESRITTERATGRGARPASLAERGHEAQCATLATRGLRVSYRRRGTVIDGCDLDIAAGTAVGLVGANGAGKTTLARCLCGIQKEAAGTVELMGKALKAPQRAGVIYLAMQEPGYQLFEHTVARELDEAYRRGSSHALQACSVGGLMDEFRLTHLAQRHPLSLSGGQAQRTSIAAGLLYGAQALVMDEPTSGLDYHDMASIARQINRLKQQGVIICIITHDYEFLCAACDAVIPLDGGRLSSPIPLIPETLGRIRELLGFSSRH